MTSNEVHDLATQVALLEAGLTRAQGDLQRLREEMEANALRNEQSNTETRGRLLKIEDMINDLKTNTALTRQALEGIETIASDLAKDRVASTNWREKQDAKWNQIKGAKWVVGVLVLLFLGMSDAGEHILKFLH